MATMSPFHRETDDTNGQDVPHVIVANAFGFYCVPKAFLSLQVPRVLAKGLVYEPNTLNLMRRLMGSGDVVAGGAFVGDFFPALCEALASEAVLHSFEPNPVSWWAATQTIRLNKLTQVRLHATAVGESERTMPLQVAWPETGDPLAARSKLTATPPEGSSVDVQVRRLDDLVPAERRVSVLQLDVEGSEGPALEGAERIIADNAPVIFVESVKPSRQQRYLKSLQERFPDHSYQMAGVIERNCIFRPDR